MSLSNGTGIPKAQASRRTQRDHMWFMLRENKRKRTATVFSLTNQGKAHCVSGSFIIGSAYLIHLAKANSQCAGRSQFSFSFKVMLHEVTGRPAQYSQISSHMMTTHQPQSVCSPLTEGKRKVAPVHQGRLMTPPNVVQIFTRMWHWTVSVYQTATCQPCSSRVMRTVSTHAWVCFHSCYSSVKCPCQC